MVAGPAAGVKGFLPGGAMGARFTRVGCPKNVVGFGRSVICAGAGARCGLALSAVAVGAQDLKAFGVFVLYQPVVQLIP